MTRVVVVGNGMAGARLVQELRARDHERRLDVTVFAAEPDASYNRVLLSELLAGRTTVNDIYLTPEGWYDDNDVVVHSGVAVTSVDRLRRQVTAADGTITGYDVLVLATGSVPWTPPVDGLLDDDGDLADGAIAFRTVDDCRRIIELAADATKAVVVGGGLLGLEAARGLAGRGLDVEVVHPFAHLMERQLDAGAGRVLARTMRDLGVRVRLGVTAAAVRTEPGDPRRRIRAVELTDGSSVDTTLLVLACGIRPDVGLARAAGLQVEQGIVVDSQLRSVSDDAVFAIGECAQHEGLVYGLVAPAWEQAAVVADVVSGTRPDASYTGSSVVTRLKAAGVDLAAMGDTATDDGPEREVVQFSDPARGTYKKLVIRDGRLVGAILLGDCTTAGTVVQLFDRGQLVPSDPASLMFPALDAPTAAASPALMPAATTICRCNNVTKRDIQACWLGGARDVATIASSTRATTGCGTCRDAVTGIVEWLAETATAARAEATA